MTIAVAISGGVDSLCALYLLKSRGIFTIALHGVFHEESNLEDIQKVCDALRTPLHILNLTDVFNEQIVQPFATSYATGQTPNPCAWCNRKIKFGVLWEHARSFGAEKMATGHYCKIVANPYGHGNLLARATDKHKDQSYFLSLLFPEQISHALFPLADFTKEQCKKIIADAGLVPPLTKESQDICFQSQKRYTDLLQTLPNFSRQQAGSIYLLEKNKSLKRIGTHKGLWNYTEGQRRGIDVPWREPLYVICKNINENALIVGDKSLLAMSGCHAQIVSLHVSPELWPENPQIKLRYNQQLLGCSITIDGNEMSITLHESCLPTAPGQVAAVYDSNGFLLAGGIITEIEMPLNSNSSLN